MKAQIQNSLFMVSEIKVSYQPKFNANERPKINQSKDAYNILFNNWDQGRIEMTEQFFILLLNRANKVIGMTEISSGGFSGTVVDLKLVFGIVLKCCASSIIHCHNCNPPFFRTGLGGENSNLYIIFHPSAWSQLRRG